MTEESLKTTQGNPAADSDVFDGVGLGLLATAASFHLRTINIWVARYLDKAFEGTAVAGGTGKVTTLVLAASRPGITAAEIAVFAEKDAPAMTRVVDRLTEQGLLERRADPASRRRVQLFVTDAGAEMVDRINAVIQRERQDVFGVLNDEDHDHLVRLLRKVSDAHLKQTKAGFAG